MQFDVEIFGYHVIEMFDKFKNGSSYQLFYKPCKTCGRSGVINSNLDPCPNCRGNGMGNEISDFGQALLDFLEEHKKI